MSFWQIILVIAVFALPIVGGAIAMIAHRPLVLLQIACDVVYVAMLIWVNAQWEWATTGGGIGAFMSVLIGWVIPAIGGYMAYDA